MVYGIIVGHVGLPRALLDAAAAITGQSDRMTVISNQGLSAEALDAELEQAIDACPEGDILVFVDMFGSSCATSSARIMRKRANVAVICGVNLPMLIRFLSYRDKREFSDLVRLVQETGPAEIRPVC